MTEYLVNISLLHLVYDLVAPMGWIRFLDIRVHEDHELRELIPREGLESFAQDRAFCFVREVSHASDEHVVVLAFLVLTCVSQYELVLWKPVLLSYICRVNRSIDRGVDTVVDFGYIGEPVLLAELLGEVRHEHEAALALHEELSHFRLPARVIPREPMEPWDAHIPRNLPHEGDILGVM